MEPVQKFLPLLVYTVNYCPQSELEWQEASAKLNCTTNSMRNRYHCVPNHERTALLEFCYDDNRILVPKRRCLELADSRTLDAAYNCTNVFTTGCPVDVYFSDELYKYGACTKINREYNCFLADPKCPEETRSTMFTNMIESTTSEVLKTETTDASSTSRINFLAIIAFSLLGILVIAIIVRRLWKYRKKFQQETGTRGEHIQNRSAGQGLNFIADKTEGDNTEMEAMEQIPFIANRADEAQGDNTEMEPKEETAFFANGTGVQDIDGSGNNKISLQRISSIDSYAFDTQPVQRNRFNGFVRKFPSESVPLKRRIQSPNARKMVAAIDIGTTYSGYCYSFQEDFLSDPLNINVHKWNTANTKLDSLKTPTTILLDKNKKCIAFGYDADAEYAELAEQDEHKQCYYFRRFKMGLKCSERSLSEETMLKDITEKKLNAVIVFTKAIGYLMDHMLKEIKDNIKTNEIYWVLTVPAVWGDDEKHFIFDAARLAGISNLVITEEAKAVTFYCKHLPMEKMKFAEGALALSQVNRYLVLDAGGGTVDITVHKIDFDGSLKDVYKCGGPFGGITVDENFKKLLEDIVGKEFLDEYAKLETADYIELWQNFETRKRLVKDEEPGFILVKIPGSLSETFLKRKMKSISNVIKSKKYRDSLTWDVVDKLKISKQLFVSFYKEAYTGIIDLVEEVLKNKNVRGTKTIIMVGGFSESPLLQKKIKDSLKDCSVFIPQEPGLAVLKGAVLYGYQPHVYPLCHLYTRSSSC